MKLQNGNDVATFKIKPSNFGSVNALDAVVITAGTLEAGDKSRVSVLKPLDIVTTAGSAGNIMRRCKPCREHKPWARTADCLSSVAKPMKHKPLRWHSAAQPYGATTNNLPRTVFSFLFSGISFSGGYSAEYGEALSSVFVNTQDEPDQNKTEISLMTVGLGIGNTQKWKKVR
jgi:hypothetical protein